MRRALRISALLLAFALPAQAQDQTLADIRQELSVLFVQLQRLNRELSTTGRAAGAISGGTMLERIDLIEGELRRLTGKTEELEFRINRIVADGTNRLGDLDFRLCELEPGCDIAKLGETPRLGGGSGAGSTAAPAPQQPAAPPAGAQMAVGEQADFDAAMQSFQAGSYRQAADGFSRFTATYSGGPLIGQAHYWRGVALAELGETAASARAYLESFSGSPQGAKAPQALYGLGVSLGQLGQSAEACVTLGEVGSRYPASAVALDAARARRELNCPG